MISLTSFNMISLFSRQALFVRKGFISFKKFLLFIVRLLVPCLIDFFRIDTHFSLLFVQFSVNFVGPL